MEEKSIISKLKKSLEKDYGDYGRTQYVIEKLEKDIPLPKSDHLYIERMIKLCEIVIEEPEPEETPEIALSENLIKCHYCNLQIELDEKSIRKTNFWFHDKCFEKIPIEKPQVSQKIEVVPKDIRQSVRVVESKATYTQMIFSGGLLASLVGTVHFFAGETLSIMIGLWGSVFYLAVYR